MKLDDAKTSELLPLPMQYAAFLTDAFDTFLHYMSGRANSLPAPMTLEACKALNDEEMQVLYDDFGLAKYYPDISHDRRAWLLWKQQDLWRWLGTPKAIETLCMYLFDDVDVHLEVKDNEAWDAHGNLINEDLLDVFDVELTIDSLNLPSEMFERVKANIIRFVRNQEWMRAFVFLFEAMYTTTGVSITDGERYARDYLIDLSSDDTLPIDLRLGTSNNLVVSRDFSITPKIGQYGFLLDFEDWETSSGYNTGYNITKDGFGIDAVGRVIGFTSTTGPYPISGSRSFVLNGAKQFNNYIDISGIHGVGTVSMKVAPWKYGNGDVATLVVSDGTTTRRILIDPFANDFRTLAIEFNNPSAQQIKIYPVTQGENPSRIRIDDIRF